MLPKGRTYRQYCPQKDHLIRCTSSSDRCDRSLYRLSPDAYIDVMRLVHDTENNFGLALVFRCELCPEVCKLSVGRAIVILCNDLVIKPCIVVDINDAESASREAGLHELVVLVQVCGIQLTTKDVVDQELPTYGY